MPPSPLLLVRNLVGLTGAAPPSWCALRCPRRALVCAARVAGGGPLEGAHRGGLWLHRRGEGRQPLPAVRWGSCPPFQPPPPAHGACRLAGSGCARAPMQHVRSPRRRSASVAHVPYRRCGELAPWGGVVPFDPNAKTLMCAGERGGRAHGTATKGMRMQLCSVHGHVAAGTGGCEAANHRCCCRAT